MAKILVIGGGFGGLSFLQKARKSKNEFVLIDKTNHHLFQPLLYQVATAVLSPADITVPLRNLFKNDKNVKTILSEVKEINKEKKEVTLDNAEVINYDKLIVSAGSSYSFFGKNEWSKFAKGLKVINDALDIREKILKAFEKAENEKDEKIRKKYLNFVIVGGGPTGVELAGSIAEIAYKNMTKEFRTKICNPEKSFLSKDDVTEVVVPAFEGEMGILKDHISIISFLKPGIVKIMSGSEEENFYVDDGIVEFKDNSLSILTSNIFNIKNSDKVKLQEMVKQAEADLADENLDDQKRFIISQKVEVLKSLSLN